MIIKKYLIKEFNKLKEEEPFYSVYVPRHSKLRCVKALGGTGEEPGGIYAFYETPSIVVEGQTEKFIIVIPEKDSVPSTAEFVDIIEVILEIEDNNQAQVLIPIYRMRSPANLGGILRIGEHDGHFKLKTTENSTTPIPIGKTLENKKARRK